MKSFNFFKNITNQRSDIKKPPVLFKESQEIIKQIEDKLKFKCIFYWTSWNGSVCDNDVIVLNELINNIGKTENLALIINSHGGNGQASLRMINLLWHNTKNLYTYIPSACSSAATMLALGGKKIFISEIGYLTAIDTAIKHDLAPMDKFNNKIKVSNDEIIRILKLWKENKTGNDFNPFIEIYKYIHPSVIGSIDRSNSLSIKLCNEILSYHMNDQKLINEISSKLNFDYPSHQYPITYKEAKKLGLDIDIIDNSFQTLFLQLIKIYSEMCQKAYTDYDEKNYHNNEIMNILETRNIQIHFQVDEDMHYRTEEQRWVGLNDKSSWRKYEFVNNKIRDSIFYID